MSLRPDILFITVLEQVQQQGHRGSLLFLLLTYVNTRLLPVGFAGSVRLLVT